MTIISGLGLDAMMGGVSRTVFEFSGNYFTPDNEPASIIIDPKNNVWRINGVDTTFDQILVFDDRWGGFDETTIVPGTGISSYAGHDCYPTLHPDLAPSFMDGEFSALFVIAVPAHSSSITVGVSLLDIVNYNSEADFEALPVFAGHVEAHAQSAWGYENLINDFYFPPGLTVAAGVHRYAITWSGDQILCSIDGADAHTFSNWGAADTPPDTLGFQFQRGGGLDIYAETVLFFPVQSAENLRMMSALELAVSVDVDNPDMLEVGIGYGLNPIVNGGATPYTFDLSSGVLPSGLTFDSETGTIGGVPDTVEVRNGLIIRVTDANNTTAYTLPFSLEVRSYPQISWSPDTTLTVGEPFSVIPEITGGWPPYVVQNNGDPLPFGFSLNTVTGEISGTAISDGVFPNISILARDQYGQVNLEPDPFDLTITYADTPEWLTQAPDGSHALVDLQFKDDHYWALGAEQDVTDILEDSADLPGAFSFANIEAGKGLGANSDTPEANPVLKVEISEPMLPHDPGEFGSAFDGGGITFIATVNFLDYPGAPTQPVLYFEGRHPTEFPRPIIYRGEATLAGTLETPGDIVAFIQDESDPNVDDTDTLNLASGIHKIAIRIQQNGNEPSQTAGVLIVIDGVQIVEIERPGFSDSLRRVGFGIQSSYLAGVNDPDWIEKVSMFLPMSVDDMITMTSDLPEGSAYVVDENGDYVVDENGEYVVASI